MEDRLGLGIFIGISILCIITLMVMISSSNIVCVSGGKGDVKVVSYKGVAYKLVLLTASGGEEK